jgi:hypothetical protein
MGHGAWMKITQDENIAPETLHISVGICFESSSHPGIEKMPNHSLIFDTFRWVISFEVQVSRLMFS